MHKNFKDLTGERFGKLVVIEPRNKNRWGNYMWLCKCDCGNEKITRGNTLTSNRIRSCGCAITESSLLRRLPIGQASFNSLFGKYKRSAKRRNIVFTISISKFAEITKQDCTYCGCKPKQLASFYSYNGEYLYNGLDRLNNSKGYTDDNCVPCCKRCNYAKHEMSLDEFKEWIDRVYNMKQLGKF